ncbi:short-chain dehydrogenase [Rummeliibacillus pycnus]|uniref:short-chain dehydrogenase n=1 Tax=Rummeliibacillus pycnus TaxID=101070 RepID=UPI003D296A4A
MGVWTWPLVFVALMISALSLVWTMRIAKNQEVQSGSNDESVSKTVEENPTMLNPIFWFYGIAGLFMGLVMAYYILLYR